MNYDDIDAINWSRLKALQVSPKQFKYEQTTQRRETASLAIGLAVHTLVLEPAKWEVEYEVWDGARRGKDWLEFKDANSHKRILTNTEVERVFGCANAIRNHPLAQQHLSGGVAERVVTWTDEETGLACKGRADVVNGHLVELKTARNDDIEQRSFQNSVMRYGYHCQLAYYLDGCLAAGVLDDPFAEPAMVMVQSEAPHDVAVYHVPKEVLDVGREEYRRLLRLLKDCRETNRWPGVAEDKELTLYLPAWATVEEEPITLGGKAMAV